MVIDVLTLIFGACIFVYLFGMAAYDEVKKRKKRKVQVEMFERKMDELTKGDSFDLENFVLSLSPGCLANLDAIKEINGVEDCCETKEGKEEGILKREHNGFGYECTRGS